MTASGESGPGAQRQALRQKIGRATATIRGLPVEEQKRLFAQSRARSPTLFALLGRFQADPALGPLVRVAVERTRTAPVQAELARAASRQFNSAFRAGQRSFRQALCFVLDRMREEFGEDNAKRVPLAELQRRYLAVSARLSDAGIDTPAQVMAVATVAEVWKCAGQSDLPAAQPCAGVVAAPAPGRAPPADDAPAQQPLPVEDELLATGMVAACLHIEAGVRSFPDFAEAMVLDLGDAARPYLRMFFEAIRHYPGFDLSGLKATGEGAGGFGF